MIPKTEPRRVEAMLPTRNGMFYGMAAADAPDKKKDIGAPNGIRTRFPALKGRCPNR
jgi:hypothetical protein